MKITRKHVVSFIFLAIFSVIQLISLAFLAQPVLADEALFNNQAGINEIGNVYGNNKTDVRVIIANFIKVILGFLAAIFLVLIVFSGFRYMTAAGNEEQTKKAVAQIRDAVIGLLIVIASWALTAFILRLLSRAVANNVVIQ